LELENLKLFNPIAQKQHRIKYLEQISQKPIKTCTKFELFKELNEKRQKHYALLGALCCKQNQENERAASSSHESESEQILHGRTGMRTHTKNQRIKRLDKLGLKTRPSQSIAPV
jgi:hypothetical protein